MLLYLVERFSTWLSLYLSLGHALSTLVGERVKRVGGDGAQSRLCHACFWFIPWQLAEDSGLGKCENELLVLSLGGMGRYSEIKEVWTRNSGPKVCLYHLIHCIIPRTVAVAKALASSCITRDLLPFFSLNRCREVPRAFTLVLVQQAISDHHLNRTHVKKQILIGNWQGNSWWR